MKRLIAIVAVIGLGLAGFAGTCNLLNTSLTTIGSNDVYGAQLQNNTGANFLTHSFKVGFIDANGNLVDTKTNVPGCLRSWQNGASDFFSVKSTASSGTTANALGALDLGSSLTVGTTVPGNIDFSNLTQVRTTTQLKLTGTIKNLDSDQLVSPAVCAVVYSSSGKVIITGKVSTGTLAANSGSANFTINLTVPDNATTISRVDYWADGLNADVPITPQSDTNHAVTTGAAKVVFSTQPSTTATGGSPFAVQPKVTLQDASGNTITTGAASTADVTLTLAGGASGAALTCNANPVAAVAGIATFAGCKIDKASATAYTLTASSPGSTSATSTGITVSVGTAAKVGFTTQPPATGTASMATFGAVAAIQDLGGNTVSSTDSIALTIASGPSGAALAGCTADVPAVAGLATFTGCQLDKAGSYTLRARNQTTTMTDGISNSMSITAGSATQLVFTTAPVGANEDANFATQPVVAVEDAQGNIVTTDNATKVTLAYGGAGTLSCTTNPVTVSAGVATFAGCKVDTSGTGDISVSSDPVLTAPTPVSVTIAAVP